MAALKYFISLLLIPFILFLAILAILGSLAAVICPDKSIFIAFMGLSLPLLLFINLICFICLLIRKRWWAIIPALAILANIPFLLSVFQFNIGKETSEKKGISFRMATYNVGTFKSWERTSTQHNIAQYMQEQQIDIICFQEYMENDKLSKDSLSSLLGLPYNAVSYLNEASYAKFGTGIFSRYPIINYQKIPFSSTTNDAMWADIQIGQDTIRIFSCHLQTTSVRRKQKEIHKQIEKGEVKHSIFTEIIDKLSENFKVRAWQADIVRQAIDTTPYPVIVVGDFNDTPVSYSYHKIKGDLKDGFEQCGKGYGYTFRGIGKLLRIDYILHSDKIKSTYYDSPLLTWSDHKPVIMELSL